MKVLIILLLIILLLISVSFFASSTAQETEGDSQFYEGVTEFDKNTIMRLYEQHLQIEKLIEITNAHQIWIDLIKLTEMLKSSDRDQHMMSVKSSLTQLIKIQDDRMSALETTFRLICGFSGDFFNSENKMNDTEI